MKILVIYSSMIKENSSYSRSLTKRFLEKYKKINPNDEITELELNYLPSAQKTLTSENMLTFFNSEDSDFYINQLKSVDKVVISVPMTNFNYPAVLKNYLDHILVADKTFSYKYSTKTGAIGLLTNLKVQILATQGAPYGWYKWGNHVKILEGTWKFVGAKVNKSILLAGTKVSFKGMSVEEAINTVDKKINRIVKKF